MPFKTPELRKEYYQLNKDRIKEQQSMKCQCECGSTYTKRHRSEHIQSMKHKLWTETNNHEIIIKTPEEISDEKKQKKKEQAKKYRDNNRDKLREYAKLYSQTYRVTHSESIAEYQKKWLQTNYEKYKQEVEEIKKLHFEGDDENIDDSTVIHILIQRLNKADKQ